MECGNACDDTILEDSDLAVLVLYLDPYLNNKKLKIHDSFCMNEFLLNK